MGQPYNNYEAKIKHSLQQADEGKLITFTLDELEALESMDTDKAREFLDSRRLISGLKGAITATHKSLPGSPPALAPLILSALKPFPNNYHKYPYH